MPVARARSLLLLALVFAGCVVGLSGQLFSEPNRFDEGFLVSGAMMIRQGRTPLADFFVMYGPAQYYWLAGLFGQFGEELLVARIYHLLTLAMLGCSVTAAATLVSPNNRAGVALSCAVYVAMVGYAMPTPSYPALPAALLLLWSVWPATRWCCTDSRSGLVAASALAGCAGLFRWDFGLYGMLALGVAVIALNLGRRRRPLATAGDVAAATAPGFGLLLLGFGTFVLLGGWQRWVDEVLRYVLFDFATWRGLPFVAPALDALLHAAQDRKAWAFSNAIIQLAFAVTPFVLIICTLALTTRRLLSSRKLFDRGDAAALMVALISLALLNQMRVRPSLGQGLPAFVLSLPLAAYLLAASPHASGWLRSLKSSSAALALLTLCALPAYDVVGRLYLTWSPGSSWMAVSKAGSTRLRNGEPKHERWTRYREMVDYVRANTAHDEVIFSGVADTSRLLSNDVMLYFLADRPAATRWMEMEPGLTNTVTGQREVIAELQHSQVRLVVLWNLTSDEPNASSHSNQVHLLDDFLRDEFVVARRFGDYQVLTRQLR